MRRPLRRPSQPRRVGRKVLIACEGEATEPVYFNALRISLRLQTVQVRVVRHGGTDPRSIVRAALAARRDEQRVVGGWERGAANTEHRHPNPSTGVAELVRLLLELKG